MTQSEHDFFDWLACSVVLADDFETNPGFYREVICRKLVRLGMLKLEDDKYMLPDPSRWRGEVTCIEEPDCRAVNTPQIQRHDCGALIVNRGRDVCPNCGRAVKWNG